MRIGIQDIKDIETKGKWWLVGSAWAGREPTSSLQVIDTAPSSQLAQLAKSQKMNTDVRRSVFVVLMSSEVQFHVKNSHQAIGLRGCIRTTDETRSQR